KRAKHFARTTRAERFRRASSLWGNGHVRCSVWPRPRLSKRRTTRVRVGRLASQRAGGDEVRTAVHHSRWRQRHCPRRAPPPPPGGGPFRLFVGGGAGWWGGASPRALGF